MRVLKSIATVVGVLVAATAVQAQDADRLSLGNKSESLELKGDLRIRYERREQDPAERQRDRLRTRFRLGMKFKTEWGWEAAAGLATGGDDSTSTNATWDNDFATGDIRLDYAYVAHKFGESAKLTLGQQKNPFLSGGILWDSDVRPSGFTYQQSFGPGFVTGGYYNSSYESWNESLGELYALQGGVKMKGDVSFTVAGTFYNWNSQAAEDNYIGPYDDDIWPTEAQWEADKTALEEELKIAGFYGDVSMTLNDKAALKLWTEYTVNTGADSDFASDNNTAMTIGGQAKLDKVRVSAQYYSTEAASTYAGLVDGDSNGPGWEGVRLKVGYGITKNFSVGLLAQFAEEIVESGDPEEESLYQVDLKYKF